jgi:hypothetical protein
LSRISSAAVSDRGWPQIYLGVALTTLATLVLELSLTRIFSVVFYYHFAFLAISIALFGLGAGGVFSYVVAGWRGNFYLKLGLLAAVNSLVVLGSLIFVISRPSESGTVTLALIYFASALPFFLSGTIVSAAVAKTVSRVDRVYFFDLMGAAAGCLVLVPFLNTFGGPNTVLASAIVFAASAAIWFSLAGTLNGRVAAVALALAFVALVVFNGKYRLIDIRYAKGMQVPQEEFVKWNSFSRIGVHPDRYGGKEIVIDGDASTAIAHYDFDRLSDEDRFRLLHQGPGLTYFIRPGAKALIIGAGGGWDVSRALASGSRDITAVEINPIIATTVMRQRFAEYSRNLYFRPEVHVAVEDGRSFVRRSSDKYQVLQATLVDTWASTAAGAFALSENNLYTTDAFRDYLSHLTPDGMMVFTRWGFEPPRESLRLLSLAVDALHSLGETQPWSHVLVFRDDTEKLNGWGAQDTVMLFRKPISGGDLAQARLAIAGTRLHLIYSPADPSANEFGKLLHSSDPEAFRAAYPFDISPVDDDRPFFFYTVQPRDLWNFLRGPGLAADYKINRALPLLFGSLAISLVATAVILLLPPLLLGARLPAEKGLRSSLMYFVCIGAGYILVQVALIQKFVLFLGHPTYALTVIIFSMLVSSGLGSFFSRKLLPAAGRGRLAWVLTGVAAAVGVVAFAAAPISEFGVGWPLPLKMAATACLIAPVGFLMGMPFPTGMSRLEARYPRALQWAWSLNAAASVMGSAGAIFLAIYLGLRLTLLIGGAMYLGALAVMWIAQERARESAPVGVAQASWPV